MTRRNLLKYTASLPVAGSIPSILRSESHSRTGSTSRSQSPSEDSSMHIQRLAWAGIKIVVDKTTLFIDATSYHSEGDLPLQADTEQIHAVITHHHSDHFDPEALKKIFNHKSQLLCSNETLPWVDTRDFRTHGISLHQPIDVSRWTGDLVAIPVPAVDGFGHPQVSWVVRGGGKTIIHCGDTLWHGYWRDIAMAYGPFDMAFVPINAARMTQGTITDTGIPAIMNPEQAVVAAMLLNAKTICPIHFGRSGGNYIEIPDPEDKFVSECRLRQKPYILPKQGEWIKWGNA